MPGPWDKYAGQQLQGQGPWAKYGGSAPPPDAGMTPPPMPRAPIPQELQGPPAPQYGQDVMQAAQRGTLRQQMMQDAQPYVQSAQWVGTFGAGPGNLAANVRGAGKVAGLAEKFSPWSRLSRAGEAIEGVSGSLAQQIGRSAPTLPDIPLREQMAQQALQGERVAQRFSKPTSGRSTGARPPRPDLIEQMGGKPIEDVANSDAAVKERIETSPEVSYYKNAKRHQGPTSKTYPEPDYFQEQGAERAPWGGLFPRQ